MKGNDCRKMPLQRNKEKGKNKKLRAGEKETLQVHRERKVQSDFPQPLLMCLEA